MNLLKAIEILTLMGTPEFEGHTEDILAARRLGIEALKRHQALQANPYYTLLGLLPGETPPDPAP